MAKTVKADPSMKKKADAAFDKYKKNPEKALNNVDPKVKDNAKKAWNKLHNDAGVKPQ